jgi:hypothetical protein
VPRFIQHVRRCVCAIRTTREGAPILGKQGFVVLGSLLALMLISNLACSASTPVPVTEVNQTAAPPVAGSPEPGGRQWKTFTDENRYLAIDVPADWEYSQDVDTVDHFWYWDVFRSPDGHAQIESVVYDDGTAWTAPRSSKQAIYLLHQFYRNTGEEDDLRVSENSIQKDGSERLTWSSRSGKSSGISFFEVRNNTAFLMLTTWWDDDYADQYRDILDQVIVSYRVP